jgi:hypothetical protein
MKTSLKFLAVFAWLASAIPALLAQQPELPNLNWTPRSDWVNVKDYGAIGNGTADDTAAIQAALDQISGQGQNSTPGPNTRRVVYLPPGTYRITSQLRIYNVLSGNILGHGRNTRLVWHGPREGTMLYHDGLVHGRIRGLSFDGRGIAGKGIYLASTTLYETHGQYEDLAFTGFTTAAMDLANDIGANRANADSLIRNCIFRSNDIAIRLVAANVYAWYIDGCDFYHNRIGIAQNVGNFYVKNSHFAYSRDGDIALDSESPTNSISRCTSYRSRRFVWDRGNVTPDVAPGHIRDNRIDRWTDPNGAIQLVGGRTLMDNVFTNPPNGNPPVRVINSPRNTGNALIVGGNQHSWTPYLVADHTRGDLIIHEIPRGQIGPSDITAQTRFHRSTSAVGGQIFNARNYGAIGNESADDTTAIQATIDAARNAGNQAIAYFPPGVYRITGPINITGSNYRIEGIGRDSRWKLETTGDNPVRVHNPVNISLEHISMIPHGRTTDPTADMLRVTATQAGCSLTINRFGIHDFSANHIRGLRFRDLHPATRIHIIMNRGPHYFENSNRAHVLSNFIDGSIHVSGAGARDGFINALLMEGPVRVHNNQSLAIEDAYCERQDHHLIARGSAGDPPGFIVYGQGGQYWNPHGHYLEKKNHPREMVLVEGYHGNIHVGGNNGQNDNPNSPVVIKLHTSGTLHYSNTGQKQSITSPDFNDFEWNVVGTVHRTLLGRFRFRSTPSWHNTLQPDVLAPGGLEAIAQAWDELRRVGRRDLEWNHSTRWHGAEPAPAPLPGPTPGVYRLVPASGGGVLAQPDFWSETVNIKARSTQGQTHRNSIFERWHIDPTRGDRFRIWFDHNDSVGPFPRGLENNNGTARAINNEETRWVIRDAGSGRWFIETGDGARLTANGTNPATISSPTSNSNQRWTFEPVTFAPESTRDLAVAVDAIGRTRISWFRRDALADRFEVQRRPNGGSWTTVSVIAPFIEPPTNIPITRGAMQTFYNDTQGLQGSYDYRVLAVNAHGATPSNTTVTRSYNNPAPPIVSTLPPNGGFEDGTSPWQSVHATRVTDLPASGAHAFRITGSPGGGVWQTVSGLKPATKYRLSVRAYASVAGQNVYLYARDFDPAGTIVETPSFTTGGYAIQSLEFTTGLTFTSAQIGVWKSSGPGYAMVDDFLIEELSLPNFVTNPIFADGDTGWQRWNSSRVEGGAAVGTHASRINGPTGGVWQTVTGLEPNTAYRLSVQAYTSVSGQNVYLYAKNFAGSGSIIESNTFATGAYATYSVDFTTGPTQTSTEIGVWKGSGSGHAMADNFILNKIPQSPRVFGNAGIPRLITSRVEAEDFDLGGQAVAYNDSTTTNQGGAYRTNETVDIQASGDTGGGFNVGWTSNGEWLEYTVRVAAAGIHQFQFRTASTSSSGRISVSLNGTALAGPLAVPSTGAWQSYTTISSPEVFLPAGTHVLRISFPVGGLNLNWWLAARVVQSSVSTPPDAKTFDTWLSTHFSASQLLDATLSGPGASPSGDGISNLEKYAYGLDPWLTAPVQALPRIDPNSPPGVFSLLFRISKNALGITVSPLWAPSIGSTDWSAHGITTEKIAEDDATEYFRSSVQTQGRSTTFMRLHIDHTP